MLRARYAFRLMIWFTGYAVDNRLWWFVPLVLVLLLAGLLVTVGQAAAPVALYPMF